MVYLDKLSNKSYASITLIMLIISFLVALSGVLAQDCSNPTCGNKLMEELFFGPDPSILTDAPLGMAGMFRRACESYKELLDCRREIAPACLDSPLEQTCVPVHDTICKAADFLERSEAGDSCVNVASKKPEYKMCLFDALAAFRSIKVADRFCGIPEPYLTFETCRLLALSNAGCDKAVFYLQPYVEAVLPFTTEACKACGNDCSPASVCQTNQECFERLAGPTIEAIFRRFPPSVGEFEVGCQDYQRWSNCRRHVHPSCLNSAVDQSCLGVQASLCATAAGLQSLTLGAFQKFYTLKNRERKALETQYSDCRNAAFGNLLSAGGIGSTFERRVCDIGNIYLTLEQCQAKVFEKAKFFLELGVYYQYNYKEAIEKCRDTICTLQCSDVSDTLCPA